MIASSFLGPLAFIKNEGYEEKQQNSFYNRPEALMILTIIEKLCQSGIKPENIGVVIFASLIKVFYKHSFRFLSMVPKLALSRIS